MDTFKHNNSERKLFIFDVGGVVIYDTPFINDFCKHYSLDYDRVFADWKNYSTPLHEGFMPAQCLYRMYEVKYNIDLSGNPFLLTYYHPEENLAVKAFIRQLRANGHRVVAGSNTFESHWNYLKNMNPSPIDGFDVLYASHEMHMQKPDTVFFEYIVKKEGFDIHDTFFFDDALANVEAACNLGINDFNYRLNNAELEKFLGPYIK